MPATYLLCARGPLLGLTIVGGKAPRFDGRLACLRAPLAAFDVGLSVLSRSTSTAGLYSPFTGSYTAGAAGFSTRCTDPFPIPSFAAMAPMLMPCSASALISSERARTVGLRPL